MAVNYNPRSVTNGLVLHIDPSNPRSYPGNGTIIYDVSGNGNNGTLTNMNVPACYVRTYGGRALEFDGVDDSVTFSGLSQFNGASKATLSGWIGKNFAQHTPCFGFANGSTVGSNRFSVIWTNGILYISAENISSSSYASVSRTGVGMIHVTAVFDGAGSTSATRLLVYVNGIQQTLSFSSTIPSSLGNVTPFILGKDSSNRFGAGQLDDIRIYNRALTQQEVLQNYNATRGRFGV